MKQLILSLFAIAFFSSITIAQDRDIVATEGIIGPLHQANIGKITFMRKPIELKDYIEADFIREFQINENTDLNIRAFMGNSLVNYLHQLAPGLNADDLTKMGNYRFSFYVDKVLTYQENLSPMAGGAENKKIKTTFRVPLISSENEDSWGRFLWARFMENGGEEALSEGTHSLEIEIRPYIKAGSLKIGAIIAKGEIKINAIRPRIDENLIKIQMIKPGSGWKVSSEKFNKEQIRELNRKIAENSFKEISSIVVIKNGNLLIEEYFNGLVRSSFHDTRSVGKTFASAITGIAIRDGHIKDVDQPLSDFYDLRDYKNFDGNKEKVSLRNLLTMTSGFEGFDFDETSIGNEENMYLQTDWVRWALDLPMAKRKPGEEWAYFSAGVVILGDILHKKLPGGLEDYADKKLFKPLGIEKYKWQYTPQKVANTAGGLQMNALDFAKFGQLYKNGGKWKGKNIIPKKWINESLSKSYSIPNDGSNYGYLWWNKSYKVNGADQEAFYCSGNGGNKIFVFKDLPFVIVITAKAYNKPYMHRQIDKMIEKYILPAIN